jgi:thioester reductase-like protein
MNVFVTGVTGLLGGEMLINLAQRSDIKKIYCLMRSADLRSATQKLQSIFDLHDDSFQASKVIPVLGDMCDDGFTNLLINNPALQNVNIIIHSAANTSFSRFHNAMVERVNLGGLENVLQWAKQLHHLQTFLYIGTATICGKDVKDRLVSEDESPNDTATHLVRYTYTKMMGEKLIRQYLPENKILIARPSIIMGDSRNIVPRSPVILWALAAVNSLRLCTFRAEAHMDCIPVDFAAEAIIKLLFAKRNFTTYHISSGVKSVTTPQQLSEILHANFNDLPPFKFIDRSFLNDFKKWSRNGAGIADIIRPFADYLAFWEDAFGGKSNLRILFTGLEPYCDFIELGHTFDNSRLLQDTGMSLSTPAHIYLQNSMEYLKKIDLMEGALQP